MQELGSFAAGSFSLGTVSYTGWSHDEANSSSSGGRTWSGAYSGANSFSDQSGADTRYSEFALGSFSNGSFSLASYLLSGTAVSWYSDNSGDQESLQSTIFGISGTFVSGITNSANGLDSVSLYQAGIMSAGAFSNVSYNYSESVSDTSVQQASVPGQVSNHTWSDTGSAQLTGSGTSGTQSQTYATVYTFDHGSGPTTAINASLATATVSLPGSAVVFQPPDPTTVPTGMRTPASVPVSAAIDLTVVATTRAWLGTTDQVAYQSLSPTDFQSAPDGAQVQSYSNTSFFIDSSTRDGIVDQLSGLGVDAAWAKAQIGLNPEPPETDEARIKRQIIEYTQQAVNKSNSSSPLDAVTKFVSNLGNSIEDRRLSLKEGMGENIKYLTAALDSFELPIPRVDRVISEGDYGHLLPVYTSTKNSIDHFLYNTVGIVQDIGTYLEKMGDPKGSDPDNVAAAVILSAGHRIWGISDVLMTYEAITGQSTRANDFGDELSTQDRVIRGVNVGKDVLTVILLEAAGGGEGEPGAGAGEEVGGGKGAAGEFPTRKGWGRTCALLAHGQEWPSAAEPVGGPRGGEPGLPTGRAGGNRPGVAAGPKT